MKRRIITIDQDKCNGCGLCAAACHENAIGMQDGKAVLLRDDYCDGLGDCLPACPTGAITFEEREAAAYDEAAVKANQARQQAVGGTTPAACPGRRMQTLTPAAETPAAAETAAPGPRPSQLGQWPVQLKLVAPNAPYFAAAHLLIAADCTAYAYANFHEDFMKNKITLIGCPKLDEGDYSEKLTTILSENNIKSVTIARMEVPCCSGLANAAIKALQNCGKMIPWQVKIITTDGRIIAE